MSAAVRCQIAHVVTMLRLQRGWDETELAKRAGISLATVRGVEAATDSCQIDTLTQLANALDVPVVRLVGHHGGAAH